MIHVENLRKEYGEFEALKISFDVPKGRIVGFWGPMVQQVHHHEDSDVLYERIEGSVTVDGLDAYTESTAVEPNRILAGVTPLYSDMIAYEYLEYVAAMRGIPAGEHEANPARRDYLRAQVLHRTGDRYPFQRPAPADWTGSGADPRPAHPDSG